MRELRQVPPPSELRPVDERRTAPERLPETDRMVAPRGRAAKTDAPRPIPDHARDSAPRAHDESYQDSDALSRFDPRRCGLPEVPKGDAAGYIERRRGDRPWLNAVGHALDEVQRVFAAVDQGGGHAHIRHEGWLSTEKSQLRVLNLQDPAQLDPVKRAEGTDGLLPGDKPHYCAAMSSAIREPTAFAIAFTRGVEHPRVRAVLDAKQPQEEPRPAIVSVPIVDLLGPDGHRYCQGFQLAGEDSDIARRDRRTWLRETRAGDRPSVPPPLLVPVDFRHGTIQYAFGVNTRGEYEIVSMYPAPPDREPDH